MKDRRKRPEMERLNLIPILDAVFIFIFFLLMSAKFVNLRQIGSDLPVVSESEPPPSPKEPLALTIVLTKNQIQVKTGSIGKVVLTLNKNEKEYDLAKLHSALVEIKRKNMDESSVILDPKKGTPYGDIVKVIDASRALKKAESPFFITKNGEVSESRKLFPKIVFSNLTPKS